MEEKNKNNLKKGIDNLNSYQPPKDLWSNIQNELENETNNSLEKAIQDLPQYQPSLSFDSIAQELDKKEGKQIHLKRYWLSAVAAAMVLLFIGFNLYKVDNGGNTNEQITYSESEEVLTLPIASTTILSRLDTEDEVYQIISKQCETSLIKCKKPEFQELFNQYVALNSEKDNLFSGIQNKQQEALLLPHIVRIEKEKSKVGKMLIQLLLS